MANNNKTVAQWMDYIQTLHKREIELGLDRVATVYRRLYPQGLACKVISVAGTNGKGSTTELISSIYHQAGYKVGKFTSPHLIDFGERYCINGVNATDDALLNAFDKIEAARGDVPITFFEYGALLAIELFSAANVDVAVMEVGLGGRLDAINILDADIAIITSISIDHTAWLGDTVEVIAREKAGIARSGKPCVVGIADTPKSIISHCDEISAELHVIDRHFNYQAGQSDSTWSWKSEAFSVDALPLPFNQRGVQLSNASLAIQAIQLLSNSLPVNANGIREGIRSAKLLARCQVLSQDPLIVLDVAHNESSVERLTEFVSNYALNKQSDKNVKEFEGKTLAVCGMLQDKEIAKSLEVLSPLIDHWHFATIDNERGASADYLKKQLESVAGDFSNINHKTINCYPRIQDAYEVAIDELSAGDRLIVFGSFFVAGDILKILANDA